MRYGVIDFGTNTLRLNVYECDGAGYAEIYDQAVFSRVVENTENGALSQDGIERVIQGIEELLLAAKHFRCDRTECFSTASLRFISNAEDVAEQIAFRTGVRVRRISGEEEARYDYLALRGASHAESGVGCDLGGGSFQLFTFDKKGPVLSHSFPLGSSRMARFHVSGQIPTEEERQAICGEVSDVVSSFGFGRPGGALLCMGGTAKAALRFCKRTIVKIGHGDSGASVLLSDLKAVISTLISAPEESVELLSSIEPERVSTLIPGMAVLSAIAETLGCGRLEIYSAGVREGFLEEILNR